MGIYLVSNFLLFLSFGFYLYLSKHNLPFTVPITWMENSLKRFIPCSWKVFTWHPWRWSWLFKVGHEGSNPSCRSKRKGIGIIFNSCSVPFPVWNWIEKRKSLPYFPFLIFLLKPSCMIDFEKGITLMQIHLYSLLQTNRPCK